MENPDPKVVGRQYAYRVSAYIKIKDTETLNELNKLFDGNQFISASLRLTSVDWHINKRKDVAQVTVIVGAQSGVIAEEKLLRTLNNFTVLAHGEAEIVSVLRPSETMIDAGARAIFGVLARIALETRVNETWKNVTWETVAEDARVETRECARAAISAALAAGSAVSAAPGHVPVACPTCVQRCEDLECDLSPEQSVYHEGCDGRFCAHGVCQECGSHNTDAAEDWLDHDKVAVSAAPAMAEQHD